jgi:hypothetical protein
MDSGMSLCLTVDSAVGIMVFCSKILCLTEWYYDKAAVILSVAKPYDVGDVLLQ